MCFSWAASLLFSFLSLSWTNFLRNHFPCLARRAQQQQQTKSTLEVKFINFKLVLPQLEARAQESTFAHSAPSSSTTTTTTTATNFKTHSLLVWRAISAIDHQLYLLRALPARSGTVWNEMENSPERNVCCWRCCCSNSFRCCYLVPALNTVEFAELSLLFKDC